MIKIMLWTMLYCVIGSFFAFVAAAIMDDDDTNTLLVGFLFWPVLLACFIIAIFYKLIRRLWGD